MENIYKVLEEISNNSGRKAKLELLKKYDGPLLRKAITLAYCPLTKFYIKQLPEYTQVSTDLSLSEAMNSLGALSSRELTGNSARDLLGSLLSNLSTEDASVLSRIVQKDLKIGCNTSTFSSVFGKDFIKETPYMGAVSYSLKRMQNLFKKNPWLYSEVKMDGRYSNTKILHGSVEMESRQSQPTNFGKAFFNMTNLFDFFREEVVTNGELIIRGLDRYTSNGYIASLVSIGNKAANGEPYLKDVDKLEKASGKSVVELLKSITYVIWDYIPLEFYNQGYWDVDREDRLNKLEEIDFSQYPNLELIEYEIVRSEEEAMDHYVRMTERGEEGTIVKSPRCPWKDGKPTQQLKIKLEMTSDMVITGFKPGNPGTKYEKTLGAVLCESKFGKVKCSSSGIPDDLRDFIWSNQDRLLGTIIEIKSCGLSSNKVGEYALLHPSVVRLRDDTTADTLDQIKQAMEMAKLAGKALKKKK